MDLDSDFLSSAMSTDALVANDMVPEGFRAFSGKSSDLPIQLINGKRYLTVDQSANQCHGSKVSKIWQYGTELRALDSNRLDKYWLCSLCIPARHLNKISSDNGNSNTGAAIRHLKQLYKVSFKEKDVDVEGEIEEDSPSSSTSTIPFLFAGITTKAASAVYQSIITKIKADDFRWFLMKWLVQMHVALVIIKSDSFR
jgi:hypothetical protein